VRINLPSLLYTFRQLINSWRLASILSTASGAMDFDARDTILYCLLHLFKGVHLDLTHALARHAELVGELMERDRLVGKPPRLEDAALARVQHRERFA